MRDLEKFYVKNTQEGKEVYFRLSPVIYPENDFTYQALKVISDNKNTQMEKHMLTYRDIIKMYEEGYYTIEKHEFEVAEALAKSPLTQTEK